MTKDFLIAELVKALGNTNWRREQASAEEISACLTQIDVALSHAHAVQSDEWQPIATAPTDGTSILATYEGAEFFVARYSCSEDVPYDGWYEQNFLRNPTHWRPLPPPPSKQEGE